MGTTTLRKFTRFFQLDRPRGAAQFDCDNAALTGVRLLE